MDVSLPLKNKFLMLVRLVSVVLGHDTVRSFHGHRKAKNLTEINVLFQIPANSFLPLPKPCPLTYIQSDTRWLHSLTILFFLLRIVLDIQTFSNTNNKECSLTAISSSHPLLYILPHLCNHPTTELFTFINLNPSHHPSPIIQNEELQEIRFNRR